MLDVKTALEAAEKEASEKLNAYEARREDVNSKGIVVRENPDVANELIALHADWEASTKEVHNLEKLAAAEAAVDGQIRSRPDPESNGPTEAKPERRSMGRQFTESPQFQGLLERGFKGKWTTGPVELKDVMSTVVSDIVQPDLRPGVVETLFQRPTVADLMPSGTIAGNTLRYLSETTATNAAAAVTEGSAKPESTLVLAEVDEPVRKIATWIPVTDEMLEDWAAAQSYIDARLRLFLELEEDDQLLNGNGTAPNVAGILDRAIQTTATGADVFEKVYNAITEVRRDAFLEPDGLVVHPTDWAGARLLRDGSDGQFYGGGPFYAPYGAGPFSRELPMWGLRVVITSAITEGTALVGAFSTAAQVFRKGGITVEASNSHDDYFIKNLTAIRAEERLALAVYRPAGFCTATGV